MTFRLWSTISAAIKSRREPRGALVERCWRVRTIPRGQEVACSIFDTEGGLEVRAGFRDDLLFSKRVVDLLEAREVAVQFRRTLREELGAVKELPL